MSKYKYYLKKPKSEITKDVLKWLAVSGAVYLAGSSPYFSFNLIKNFKKRHKYKKYKKKRLYDTFYNFKKQGLLKIERRNHQVYISLTEKGRKKANWMQIDDLKIKKPKKWDRKWRVVIFDIVQLKTLQRNAFRSKIRELGFKPLQKSVWVHPFKCEDEVALLRDFFGLTKKEICLITAEKIENSNHLRKLFKL